MPITSLLDAQLLSRRKVEKFLRRELVMELRDRAGAEADLKVADNLGEELARALEKTRL